MEKLEPSQQAGRNINIDDTMAVPQIIKHKFTLSPINSIPI